MGGGVEGCSWPWLSHPLVPRALQQGWGGLGRADRHLTLQRDCHNYIKMLLQLNSTHLYTCGTCAFSPACAYMVSTVPARLPCSQAAPSSARVEVSGPGGSAVLGMPPLWPARALAEQESLGSRRLRDPSPAAERAELQPGAGAIGEATAGGWKRPVPL